MVCHGPAVIGYRPIYGDEKLLAPLARPEQSLPPRRLGIGRKASQSLEHRKQVREAIRLHHAKRAAERRCATRHS